MKHAFRDAADGYYETDVPDGDPLPEWTKKLTACDVRPTPETDWRPASVATFKVTRDALLVVVNDMMAQFVVMSRMDDARFCLNLIQPLRDAPADTTLRDATSAADYKHKAINLWRAMATGAPDIVVTEFARAISKL